MFREKTKIKSVPVLGRGTQGLRDEVLIRLQSQKVVGLGEFVASEQGAEKVPSGHQTLQWKIPYE